MMTPAQRQRKTTQQQAAVKGKHDRSTYAKETGKPTRICALANPGRFFIASHGRKVGVQHFST